MRWSQDRHQGDRDLGWPGGAGVRSLVAIAVIAAIEAEAVVVKVIRTRIVLRILVAIVVEQAIAAAGAVVAGRGCPSDVVEAGLARQLAAGAAPGGWSARGGARVEGGLRAPLSAAHHGANAA